MIPAGLDQTQVLANYALQVGVTGQLSLGHALAPFLPLADGEERRRNRVPEAAASEVDTDPEHALLVGADEVHRAHRDERAEPDRHEHHPEDRREDERDETVTLHKFGDVTVAGVPFFVMDPAKSPNGANFIALKGGPGRGNVSDEFPQRVEGRAHRAAAEGSGLGDPCYTAHRLAIRRLPTGMDQRNADA